MNYGTFPKSAFASPLLCSRGRAQISCFHVVSNCGSFNLDISGKIMEALKSGNIWCLVPNKNPFLATLAALHPPLVSEWVLLKASATFRILINSPHFSRDLWVWSQIEGGLSRSLEPNPKFFWGLLFSNCARCGHILYSAWLVTSQRCISRCQFCRVQKTCKIVEQAKGTTSACPVVSVQITKAMLSKNNHSQCFILNLNLFSSMSQNSLCLFRDF